MAARQVDDTPRRPRRQPAATTPEGRENQLIALAMDLAERQLEDGTASAQVQTHYLKLGSPREKLERERLQNENAMLRAKIDSLASAVRVEELYEQALKSMRSYAGEEPQATFDD